MTTVPASITVGDLIHVPGGGPEDYDVANARTFTVALPSLDTEAHARRWVASNCPDSDLVDWHEVETTAAD
jgi:hypothetical protein